MSFHSFGISRQCKYNIRYPSIRRVVISANFLSEGHRRLFDLDTININLSQCLERMMGIPM
jgi:hypothetical protein